MDPFVEIIVEESTRQVPNIINLWQHHYSKNEIFYLNLQLQRTSHKKIMKHQCSAIPHQKPGLHWQEYSIQAFPSFQKPTLVE